MGPPDDHERAGRWRTRRVVVVLLAITAVTAVVFLGLRPKADRNPGEATAPDFELPRLSGGGSLASEDLRGEPYVLNFWATWCNPCREEMPAFDGVWQKYKDDGVTVVGVNLRDDPDKAREFAEDLGVSYPLVVDVDQKLAEALRVNALPQTFFVDGNGKFFEESSGSLGILTAKELEARVQAMLESEGDSG